MRKVRLPSLLALLAQPAVHTSILIAGGGLALMAGNVVYAKLLAPADFGRLVLVQSVSLVAIGLLPFGVDNLIVRREIARPARAVTSVLAMGLGLVSLLGAAGWLFLGAPAEMAAFVAIAGVAGAATRLFAAVEQSRQRFVRSQVISQLPLVLFLASAAYLALHESPTWQHGAFAFAFSHVAAAAGALVFAGLRFTGGDGHSQGLWVRALALTGIFASLLVLNQLERLVAAGTLGMSDLGALGLATTLIASPFRMLSAGVGYTLMPRLAGCHERIRRRRLVLNEFFLAMGIGLPSAVILFVAVPVLVEYFFGDTYAITRGLVVALLILGLVRLNSGLFSAIANALGNTRSLQLFNLSGWVATAIAAAAAIALSGWGSTGIVMGVTFGWIVRILFAMYLMRKEF